ncbi:hypothetical protein A4X13_0g4944 [Tilletia indica]|uniref:Cyclin N-terminal domain-containing protein n=1 Tax=Tilletia indica TaxID=43049 RepID=A0A8T8SX75_9BASI|nr:hypothetical protein A4X13_0g4944 [Tilletia indica]
MPIIDETLFVNLSAREALNPPSAGVEPNRAQISWCVMIKDADANTQAHTHVHLSREKRSKVLEWIAKVHGRMELNTEVLWLAVDIFHRFISSGGGATISAYHTGLTSLWLAAKVEGQHQHRYRLRHFARHIDDRGRTRRRMIREEAQILAVLQFRLSAYVPPTFWVQRISAARGYEPFTLRIALILVDTTVPEPCFATWRPKELASIAVLVACKMWCRTNREWSEAHVRVCGFQTSELLEGANLLLQYLRSENYKSSWMYRKYSSEEHHHLGDYVRSWALENAEI